MTKQQELQFYRWALMDWSKPISEAFETNTRFGFCSYFAWREFPIEIEEVIKDFNATTSLSDEFSTLYSLRTKSVVFNRYWFNETGTTKTGRKVRCDALKKAIKILEKELKTESHGQAIE